MSLPGTISEKIGTGCCVGAPILQMCWSRWRGELRLHTDPLEGTSLRLAFGAQLLPRSHSGLELVIIKHHNQDSGGARREERGWTPSQMSELTTQE